MIDLESVAAMDGICEVREILEGFMDKEGLTWARKDSENSQRCRWYSIHQAPAAAATVIFTECLPCIRHCSEYFRLFHPHINI